MVLVQIVVSAANNGTYINVPLFGTYDVNILNVQYHDNPMLGRPMVIQSDILRIPNSTQPYLMFINAPSSTTNYAQGAERMISIPNCDFNGKVLINVIDFTTGVAPVGMSYILITLEVAKK